MDKINKLSLPVTILIASVIVGGFYFSSQLINKQKSSERQPQVNNFDLDTQCAKQSKIFFDDYEKKDGNNTSDFSSYYENHFNKKLNKCFVSIYSMGTKDDTLFIDVFDAVEGKHYAMYIGHNNCDTSFLSLSNELKKCQLDGGNIWSNGNDTITPDFQTNNSGNGNENTKTEFTNKIQVFMND